MTAKEKIEELTTAWYGFALFGALVSLVYNGIGFFSVLLTGATTLFSLFVYWFLGRRLLARSGFFRFVLVVGAFLGMCLLGLGTMQLTVMFLGSFSLNTLLMLVSAIAAFWMNFRSFRVLTDKTVKAYIKAA